MTGQKMSGLTDATMLTILFLPGPPAVRFKVERADTPNPPVSMAADAA